MTKIKIATVFLSMILVATIVFASGKKEIIFGVAPGPYGDIVKLGVAPALEKKGYKVEIKQFSDYVQPNIALDNKSIDVYVFQHKVYLEKFAKDRNL